MARSRAPTSWGRLSANAAASLSDATSGGRHLDRAAFRGSELPLVNCSWAALAFRNSALAPAGELCDYIRQNSTSGSLGGQRRARAPGGERPSVITAKALSSVCEYFFSKPIPACTSRISLSGPTAARTPWISSAPQPQDFCGANHLTGLQIVLKFDEEKCDIVLPLHASQAQASDRPSQAA